MCYSQQAACDCLLLLFGQTVGIPAEEQNNVLFPFEFIDTFLRAWTLKTSNTVADYQFQKKLVQVGFLSHFVPVPITNTHKHFPVTYVGWG